MQNIDAEIQKIYERMVPDIQKEIESFYQRYADKEGISLAEAKRRVSKFDVKAFEARAAKMVKDRDFSDEANELMRLYNATMRINRLELLKADIGLHMIDGFDDLEKLTGEKLTEEAVKEFERQAGILGNGVKGASERAKSLVGQSFVNATFSERIWSNQEALRNKLSTILTKGLIGGKSYQSLAAEIRKDFNVSAREAMRLVRTEMVRVQTQAQIDSYKANGWEEFEFLAYGTASCEICNALNKKHFKISDFQPAENAPPMHPNCRCRTAPYEDEEEYQKWLDSFGNSDDKSEFLGQTTKITKKSHSTDRDIVDRELVNSKAFHDKFENLTGRKIVDEIIYQEAMKILEHRDGTSQEDLVVLDRRTGAVVTKITDSEDNGKLVVTKEQLETIESYPEEIVLLHNHPNGSRPSYTDILRLKDKNVSSVIAIGHDGSVYEISGLNESVDIETVWEEVYNTFKRTVDRKTAERKTLDYLYDSGIFETKKR